MQTERKSLLANVSRCVIKIGSALLTANGAGLNQELIRDLARQIAELRSRGVEVVLVTSGAVAVGMQRMSLRKRPHALHELQAMAAIGQMGLVQTYETAFQLHGLHTAQVLLTHDDLSNRGRYLNARSALRSLLKLGVIPVINENDTVATDEIRFGDNDTLAALVANLIEAGLLLILTDQEGLYDKDPRISTDAQLIDTADASDSSLKKLAGGSGEFGRGGMLTKLEAAAKAGRSGAHTIIASGKQPQAAIRALAGEAIGTLLRAGQGRLLARKQWLAGQMRSRGKLVLDEGAVRVLQQQGRSLLPVGVTRVEGQFSRGEIVSCVDSEGNEIARGLVNYSSEESGKIAGRSSDEIEAILGYVDEPELVHRDNMVVV